MIKIFSILLKSIICSQDNLNVGRKTNLQKYLIVKEIVLNHIISFNVPDDLIIVLVL